MIPVLTIRVAAVSDADLIADLSRQTFYESYAHLNRPEDIDKFMNERFTKQALMKEVGTAGNIFFLAFEEGTAVGYVRLRETKDLASGNRPMIEIARIYVSKNKIGKGVGKALMIKCIETARELQKTIIRLAVWEKNENAILFYTKFGFKKTGEESFVLGNDVQEDWVMEKMI